MIINHLPSYCYSKNKIKSVDGVVIHFISAKNVSPDDPFNLNNIIDIFKEYKVSANYLIRRQGGIIELAPELQKTYHAGKSIMNGRENCNNFTLGIELEGGTDFPYTDEQILKLGTLLGQLMTKHKFTSDWIQGHDKVRSNWNETYPLKKASNKVDPGEHFPWEVLSDMIRHIN